MRERSRAPPVLTDRDVKLWRGSARGARRQTRGFAGDAAGYPMPGGGTQVDTLLWIIAVVLVIAGIVWLVRGALLMGIVLIVVGLLVGPGGVSIFH